MKPKVPIRPKEGICPVGGYHWNGRLIGGMCPFHYWEARRKKTNERNKERGVEQKKKKYVFKSLAFKHKNYQFKIKITAKQAKALGIKPKQKTRKQTREEQRQRAYRRNRADFLKDHTECEACVGLLYETGTDYGQWCTIANPHQATDVHHKKGRIGDNLTNPDYFLAVCRGCHTWIEKHPKRAKELRLSLSRLAVDEEPIYLACDLNTDEDEEVRISTCSDRTKTFPNFTPYLKPIK